MVALDDEFRDLEREKAIRVSADRVRELLATHEWDQASHMAAQLKLAHPDSRAVVEISSLVDKAFEPYKEHLTRRFLRAASHDDTDEAMDLLRQLDRMLTPAEARPITDTAKRVIERRKLVLSQRFKLAIADRDWLRAKHIAEQILSDFGNTRMAAEIRDRMDLLRDRCRQQMAGRPTANA